MRSSSIRWWASGSIAAALLLGVLAALVAATPANARIVTIDMSFEQLQPGERRSDTAVVSLPREARLTDVVVGEESTDPDAFRWDVALCPPQGPCVPVAPSSEGTRLDAGSYELRVEVTLGADAPALASSLVTGRLVFTDDGDGGDGLPPTGVSPALLVAAVGLLVVGVGLVRVARRRAAFGGPHG